MTNSGPAALGKLFAEEYPRIRLLWPVGIMLGIGWFFSLDNDPAPKLAIWMLASAMIGLGICYRYYHPIVLPLMIWFLIALGFTASSLRTTIVATPLITSELHQRTIEGTIDEIEPVENRTKLILSQATVEGLSQAETPKRLRISYRSNDMALHAGDRVRMTANIYPLPEPNMPHSYDFARHFYFRSIGGNGYTFDSPELITGTRNSSFSLWLNNLRHHIGEDMRTHIPGDVGTVAAAMTVGESGAIPDDVKQNLRDSGLAHMLAIAGLHLGIVAGIVFFTSRLLLSFIPYIALRFPIKKIAALMALTSAAIYLLLSGAPIPATRAFVMVTIFFTGILIDRQGFSLRTLSIAAGLILLWMPEALFGASFQMSFSATLAIICISERYGKEFTWQEATGWRRFLFHHVRAIAVTSIVATLATAPFMLYNFNRFASFGLIANMVVIPLATLVIMPGMLISLILMPFGLQKIGYIPLKYGVMWMMQMAGWVSHLSFAALRLPAPTDTGLLISSIGLVWLCILQKRWRLFGLVLMALGLSTITLHFPPDLFISHDGKQIMAKLDNGHYTLIKGAERSFTVQNWLRSEGEDHAIRLKSSGIGCSNGVCDYMHNGRHVVVIKTAWDDPASIDACHKAADMIIAWQYLHKDNCPGAATLIGRSELETYGTEQLWLDRKGIRNEKTLDPQHQRIWQPALTSEEEEE